MLRDIMNTFEADVGCLSYSGSKNCRVLTWVWLMGLLPSLPF